MFELANVWLYVLAIAGGLVAGVINTLAGSGSLVTLPILVFLGLPADVANGTNRVGVVLQNVVGIWTYRKSGNLSLDGSYWLVVPSIAGAVVGAGVATVLDKESLQTAIGVVMVIMLLVILLNPKRWLREHSIVQKGRPRCIVLGVFFLVGVYGGFIQAGVGVLLLAAMVLGCGYSMNHANTIKLVIVLAFTLFVLPIFVWRGQVDWGLGILMSIGQAVGAWLAAKYATTIPDANVWVRRLLIAIVLVCIARFLVWN